MDLLFSHHHFLVLDTYSHSKDDRFLFMWEYLIPNWWFSTYCYYLCPFPPSVFRLINYFQFNSSLTMNDMLSNLYLTCKICIREKLWFKYTSLLSEAFLEEQKSQYKGDVTRDDPQRRFLEQHIVATLLGHCFEWLQHCSNIATPWCSKNRRCESSRVLNITLKDDCKVWNYLFRLRYY